jgi:hypothetical protein
VAICSSDPTRFCCCLGERSCPFASGVMPCPYCGSTHLKLAEGVGSRWRTVHCQRCRARGPEVLVRTEGAGTPEQWDIDAERRAWWAWQLRSFPSATSIEPHESHLEIDQ